MVEQDHVQKLEEGADAWNAWRRTDSEVVPDLSDHDFEDQNVHGFDFTGADLRGADLSQVKRLLPASLAAANLSGSKLPEDLAEFPALDHVAEVSKHARVNFLAVVAGCVFCWLTIAQTSDGALLANIGQMPLPVINTKVPVSGFFLFAPAILLALYVYLQLYLQRMWDGLAGLPAVFPDGAVLDEASLGQACGRGSSQHQFLKPCEDAKSTRKPAAAKPEPTDKPPVTPLPPPAKPKPRPPAQVASRGPDASLKPDETFSDCADCPAMVVIPASGFVMGSPKDEKGRWTNEGPQRPVKIASSFAVGKFEVTRGEFAQFVKDENYDAGNECWTLEEGKGENRTGRNWRNPGFEQTDRDPVVCVNWNDAKAYVAWLSEKTKQPYRLLSEAEWEYMARGGTTTSRFWGNADEGCEYANAADLTAKETYSGWTTSKCRDGYLHTSPVGRFKANAFGVHDVLGNVWEWVEDVWHDSYEGAPDDGSAWTESGNQSLRVLRGGSWGRKPEDLRSAIRGRDGNGFRGGSFGFRVSRTLSR